MAMVTHEVADEVRAAPARLTEIILLEKTRPMREAEDKARAERAAAHRLQALQPLAERMAEACFETAERSYGKLMLKSDLVARLHSELLRSGLFKDEADLARRDVRRRISTEPR